MVVGRATRPGRFTSVPLRGALFLCVRTRVRDEPSLTAVSSEGVHAPRRLHALHATLPACVAQLTASTCPQPHRQPLSNLRRVDLGVKVGSGGGQGKARPCHPAANSLMALLALLRWTGTGGCTSPAGVPVSVSAAVTIDAAATDATRGGRSPPFHIAPCPVGSPLPTAATASPGRRPSPPGQHRQRSGGATSSYGPWTKRKQKKNRLGGASDAEAPIYAL